MHRVIIQTAAFDTNGCLHTTACANTVVEMAAGRPGLVTRAGLHTFADPRIGGGRQSPSATEDLVEIVEIG